MTPTTPPSPQPNWTWTTQDLLITLAISLTIALAFIPLNNLSIAIGAVNPIAGWAVGGVFRLPVVFLAYVIRRPGAVMLCHFVSGLTWAMASPYGLFGLLASVIDGLMAESTQWAATRYRHYGVGPMLVWSLLYGVFTILVAGVLFGSLMIAPELAIPAGLSGLITYAIAGLVAPRLAEAVARTGVLTGTALGRVRAQDI